MTRGPKMYHIPLKKHTRDAKVKASIAMTAYYGPRGRFYVRDKTADITIEVQACGRREAYEKLMTLYRPEDTRQIFGKSKISWCLSEE